MSRPQKARTVLRAAVTRLLNKLESLHISDNPNLSEITDNAHLLEQKAGQLREVDSKIQDGVSDDAFEDEYTTATRYQDDIYLALARARRIIAPSAAVAPAPREPHQLPSSIITVALPKLQVPTLRARQMTAKRSVEGIAISEANYDTAISTLQNRFGRPAALVDAHIDKLLNLPLVSSARDVEKLRELYDTIIFRTGCLQNLGVPQSRYAVVLHRVVMRCIPEELAVEFRQRQLEKAPSSPLQPPGAEGQMSDERSETVSSLLAFLRSHIESREDCKFAHRRVSQREPREQRSCPSPEQLPSFPTALSLAACSTNHRPRNCPLCNSPSHAIQDCHAAVSSTDKRRLLSAKRCCFRCGKYNHVSRECRSFRYLTCSTCGEHHLSLLCDIQRASSERSSHTPTTTATCARPATHVLLQNDRVWALGRQANHLARVLFDTGSHRTYVRQDLSRRIGCPVLGTEDLTVYTFGRSKAPSRYHCRRVALSLTSQHAHCPLIIEALEVPEVCSVTTQPLDILALDKLRDLGLAAADAPLPDNVADAHISVLIGSNIYWTLVSGNIRRLTPGLTAVETRFGWLVQGAHPVSASASLDEFEHQVAKIGNRYQVPLLIKDSCFGELADNRTIAEARLFSQLRRLRDQPHLLQQYHDTISEYFSEGHAEEVPNTSSRLSNLYYLPHHAVTRQDAVTTKVRVVFDASSHMPGELSLNQVLHRGPNLNADLLVQLIAFRCHPVVLIADIRKAYLQIAIRPEDRDALRLLWIKKLPSPQDPLPDIQEWRMTRVPFGASSSPFLLAATLRHQRG
ncbi:uncharacterized protein LOC135400471 [Ornithodoros turicata]|uniref:uncharacterized protein LOC135400471 n=1 Tax=Ornithodoros turicata TaxID=34597 RepID=UPI00313928DE